MLEFSNHHQCNLQSEHTASQFRPAHLLTLAPAELRVLLSECLCACGCLCGPVCALLPLEIWVTRHWALTRAGWTSAALEATAHMHMFPVSFMSTFASCSFFIQKTHSIKCRLNKHGNALERACVHNCNLGITEHLICSCMHVTGRLLLEMVIAQRSWSEVWINVHHIGVNLYISIRTV